MIRQPMKIGQNQPTTYRGAVKQPNHDMLSGTTYEPNEQTKRQQLAKRVDPYA